MPLHPLVTQAFSLQRASRKTEKETARRAGVGPNWIRSLKLGALPSIANFDAFLGALGHRLAIVPLKEETVTEQLQQVRESEARLAAAFSRIETILKETK